MIKSYKTVFCMFGISYSQNRILQQERESRKWDFEINHYFSNNWNNSIYCNNNNLYKLLLQMEEIEELKQNYSKFILKRIQVESQNTIIYSQNEQVKQLSHYIIPIEKYEDFKKWMDEHNCKIHD